MVLHVLVVYLQHVVIGVDDAQRNRHLLGAEHLELHGSHGRRGVLQQHVVDGDGDVVAGREMPIDEVLPQDPVGQWLCHRASSQLFGCPIGCVDCWDEQRREVVP
jgi:hypothetical protein